MSKLQDLINEFETLSTTKLNDALSKQQQYKSARTIAIAISAIKNLQDIRMKNIARNALIKNQ